MHAVKRQTDGQTDRMLIARPRLHSMPRGNKRKSSVKAAAQHITTLSVSCSRLFRSAKAVSCLFPESAGITASSRWICERTEISDGTEAEADRQTGVH